MSSLFVDKLPNGLAPSLQFKKVYSKVFWCPESKDLYSNRHSDHKSKIRYELLHEKMYVLHKPKQRRRSAVQ